MIAIKNTLKNILGILLILLAYGINKIFSFYQIVRDYVRKLIKYHKFKKKLEEQNKKQKRKHRNYQSKG